MVTSRTQPGPCFWDKTLAGAAGDHPWESFTRASIMNVGWHFSGKTHSIHPVRFQRCPRWLLAEHFEQLQAITESAVGLLAYRSATGYSGQDSSN
mmetsp:Transcript_33956/g.96222  ORF Transcript_33956/g.96222 Transcript_33956/m.96222 type:complete len:95 (+) Transcript_33956:1588-1872(+)